ncbi:MAG: hypothetical protein ABEJ02_01710 [Candidatus Paceibacteria bacterium]
MKLNIDKRNSGYEGPLYVRLKNQEGENMGANLKEISVNSDMMKLTRETSYSDEESDKLDSLKVYYPVY